VPTPFDQRNVLFSEGIIVRSIVPLAAPHVAAVIVAESTGAEVLFATRNVSEAEQFKLSVTITE
jgi:hypothetical protein